jgi:hypothetical protein
LKTTKTNDTAACPACGQRLSGATSLDGDFAPQAGDLSVCCNCGESLVFNDDLTLHSISKEEMDSLSSDERGALLFYAASVATLNAARNARKEPRS